MAYNHSRKAGNLGDVWKHFILVELASVIIKNSDSFCYVESHCGAPIHELADRGEWTRGISEILKDNSNDFKYLSIAQEWLKTKQYPAGWVFMAHQLTKRFENVEVYLFDTNNNVAAEYPPAWDPRIPSMTLTKFKQEDGYVAVGEIKKPDLVFLDPPFHSDAKADWLSLAHICSSLRSRNIDFVIWYPFYCHTEPQDLLNKTKGSAWEVHWASSELMSSQSLKGCGMIVSDGLRLTMQALQTKLTRMADCMEAELVIRQSDEPGI
jgi:23S rRNA (adenine2030-N6)-methyltransferase